MLIAFHKPYGVLSQFTSDGSPNRMLAEFGFPKNVYPIGRLDADSEGLLLLSEEARWNEKLLHPRHAHEREYWAQVERFPTRAVLDQLQRGVMIQGRKTLPCKAWLLEPQPVAVAAGSTGHWPVPSGDPPDGTGKCVQLSIQASKDTERTSIPVGVSPTGTGGSPVPPKMFPRTPPIRFRKSVPDCWIGLELIEGKNRQVRRMTAAVGHPTLRLVRVRIGHFWLGDLPPGQWRVLTKEEMGLVAG